MSPGNVTVSEPSKPLQSTLERLPDEILQKILMFAMNDSMPFYLDQFLAASKKERVKAFYAKNIKGEIDYSSDDPMSSNLYRSLDTSQRIHLYDWHMISATCKRFRQLGKEVFFSSKVFLMAPVHAEKLQARQVTWLSDQDQEAALKYIRSIIFTVSVSKWQSSFFTLPRRVSAFRNLHHLGHLFGYIWGNPISGIKTAILSARTAPSHFVDALASIGCPVDNIHFQVMAYQAFPWEHHEAALKHDLYPLFAVVARARAKKNPSKSIEAGTP